MAIKHNRDIVKVATMYYKKNLKQSEIAKYLGISRSLVSKYLNDAKNEGIVDIFIKSESAYSIELELALEETFGLKKAAVLDTSSLRKDETERLLVQTAIFLGGKCCGESLMSTHMKIKQIPRLSH